MPPAAPAPRKASLLEERLKQAVVSATRGASAAGARQGEAPHLLRTPIPPEALPLVLCSCLCQHGPAWASLYQPGPACTSLQ